MNRERLERLIKILERIQETKMPFSLDKWGAPIKDFASTSLSGDKKHVEACGTACCALGYAALDPEFQAQGLSMNLFFGNDDGDVKSIRVPVETIKDFNARVKEAADSNREFLFAEPRFEGKEDFDAGAAFFGISTDDSCYIFGPDEYRAMKVTPKAVIARIKEILNDSEAVAA